MNSRVLLMLTVCLILIGCDASEPSGSPDGAPPSGSTDSGDAPCLFRIGTPTDAPVQFWYNDRLLQRYTRIRDTVGGAFFAILDSGLMNPGSGTDAAFYRLDTAFVDSAPFRSVQGLLSYLTPSYRVPGAYVPLLSVLGPPLLLNGCLDKSFATYTRPPGNLFAGRVDTVLRTEGDSIVIAVVDGDTREGSSHSVTFSKSGEILQSDYRNWSASGSYHDQFTREPRPVPSCKIQIRPIGHRDFRFAYDSTGVSLGIKAIRTLHFAPTTEDSSRYEGTDSVQTSNEPFPPDSLPYRAPFFESLRPLRFGSFQELMEKLRTTRMDGPIFLEGCLADSVDTLRTHPPSNLPLWRTESLSLHGDTLRVDFSDDGFRDSRTMNLLYDLSSGLIRYARNYASGAGAPDEGFSLTRLPDP